jgi:molybdopterin synthase sulfur carrier subunit
VKVRFYANLRAAVGAKTVELPLEEGGTVEQLVALVVEHHPELASMMLDESAKLSRRVNVFVDGRSATYLPDGLSTRLTADREIDIFPAVAGG